MSNKLKRNAPEKGQKGGGSRAAKKRAKKKEKQQSQEPKAEDTTLTAKDDEVELTESKGKVSFRSNISDNGLGGDKKLQLPLEDDVEDDSNEIQIKTKKKKKKKKTHTKECNDEKDSKKDEKIDNIVDKADDMDETKDDDDNWEDQILDQFLSKLTPAEILFPETFITDDDDDDEKEAKDKVGDEQPHPLTLVANVPTEKRANTLFSTIIAPSGLSRESFYKHYWEKKPLLISRSENLAEPDSSGVLYGDQIDLDGDESEAYEQRLDGFISKKDIETMISDFPIKYGTDLNVTNYCNTGSGENRRITLDQLPNMDGTEKDVEFIDADSKDVWSNFKSGCTLRLLCPQKYNDRVHCMLSNLEHEFGCMVGSNAYLTPGGSQNQGFAPHYDDIEAFILQLEGYKHWRVYQPMSKKETLPRESSNDFTEKKMKDVDPVIDIVLGPGDVLYMPRGWIHQANTCKTNHHSLHLTVSAMQNWSWVDLLETMMPEALEAASESSSSLRTGLPRNFLSYMGTMHEVADTGSEILEQLKAKNDVGEVTEGEEDKKEKRIKELQDTFKAEAKKRIMRVCKEAISMVSSGCDQIGKRFLSDRLPPALTANEAALTSENRVETGGKIFPNTMVRLAKPGLARLVVEEEKAVVYHSLDNSRVYHEHPLSPMEFEIDDAPALEMLLTTIEPHWICVQDLIHGDIEDKMDIAQSLYDEGILAMFQDDRPDRSVQTG